MSALAPLLERRMLLQLTTLQTRARGASHGRPPRLGASWHVAAAAAAVPAQPAARRRHLSWSAAPAARRAAAAAAAASSPTSAEQQQQQAGSGDPPHVSVLLHEVMSFFDGMNVATYVDGTLGAAGHASEVLCRHPELTTLVGFDLDTTAHSIAIARLQQAGAHVEPVIKPQPSAGAALASRGSHSSSGRGSSSSMALPELPLQPPAPPPTAYIIHSNFGSLGQLLPQLQGGALVGAVDAMLLDLGMSSMQVDESERGFSFLRDGPLDMRMDASPGSSAPRSAEELVNTASEAELGSIFKELGEERYWKSIARRIVSAREEEPIRTTQQLVKVIGNPGGGGGGRGGRVRGDAKQKHPATRVFQALRIAVNDELGSIARALPDAIDCLRPGGGRLAVITFHSLEDRIVKWAFRRAAGMAPSDEALPSYCVPFHTPLDQPLVRILTRRPVVPGEEEQAANSRSRSAKLRVVERL